MIVLQVPYKLHAMLHTVACACVLMMGLRACTEDGIDTYLACFTRTCPGVALASVTPSLVLYLVEAWQRRTFLQSSKSG